MAFGSYCKLLLKRFSVPLGVFSQFDSRVPDTMLDTEHLEIQRHANIFKSFPLSFADPECIFSIDI